VTIHYPFHPLAGEKVTVLADQKESVTVRGPDGFDLKVPTWMVSPAARVELSMPARIDVQALRAVTALVADARRALTAPLGEVGDPPTSQPEKNRHAPTRTRARQEHATQKSHTAGDTVHPFHTKGRRSGRSAAVDGASHHRRHAKRGGGRR
jgi:hypothetical protein